MSVWKTIKEIEKIQPGGFEVCGFPKAPYYVIHYEDGTSEEADFIAEHDEEDFVDDEKSGFVPRTEEEILGNFREAVQELKLSLEGKVKMKTWEEFCAELDNDE